jgi:hypothetical protein
VKSFAEQIAESEKRRAESKQYFEVVFTREQREGRLPLEFAGPKGKEQLQKFFEFGCAYVAIDMLKMIVLDKMGGDKKDATDS